MEYYVMNVRELIEFLQKHDPEMPVAFRQYSEQAELEADEIEVKKLTKPRPDGWIQNYRPDMEAQYYLLFPGN
jgi:hypothetical protein